MNFLTEDDSTFHLSLVFDFLFQQDIPYWLKVIYISTGTFPSLTNPKGNLTPVKECASLLSIFMNPKFCQWSTTKYLKTIQNPCSAKQDLPGLVTSYCYYDWM